MVAPLVVGAARVATTTAKVGTKAGKTAIKAGRATSKAGAKGARVARNITKPVRRGRRQSAIRQTRATAQQSGIEKAGYKAGRLYAKVQHRAKQATSSIKGLSLTWQLLWFYPPQLLFAFISYAAYSALNAEYGFFWGIAMDHGGYKVAMGLFLTAWVFNLALGSGLLLYIAVVCNLVYKLKVWRYSSVLITFCICLWGYWTPYFMLMFIPWTIIWVWVIVWSQK